MTTLSLARSRDGSPKETKIGQWVYLRIVEPALSSRYASTPGLGTNRSRVSTVFDAALQWCTNT